MVGTWPAHHASSEVRWLVLLILIPLTGFGWMGGWVEHNNLFPGPLSSGCGGSRWSSAHCWVLRRQPLLVVRVGGFSGCRSDRPSNASGPCLGVGVVVVRWLGCVVVC
jgi:hypothetical protein